MPLNAQELLQRGVSREEMDRVRAAYLAEQARRSGSRSFAAFVKQAWPIFETTPLVWDWYMDAVCQHLEAAARGEIRRLVINFPPRMSKSNLCAILFPAWVWSWAPRTQFMYLSYAASLSTDHSVKCRQVIESEWYRETHMRGWTLRSDQNVKSDFVNTVGGRRRATSVDGSIIGYGADIAVIDDPIDVREAHSTAALELAWRVVSEVTTSRFNNLSTSRGICVMQRLDKGDVAARLIELGWTPLVLPMEFDVSRRCVTRKIVQVPSNGLPAHKREEEFWRDPRTEPGQLLSPERFPREEVEQLKKSRGSIVYAALYQQNPVAHAMAGAYFKRAWFKILDEKPTDVVASVRRWDLASTEGGGDWTVGVKLSRLGSGAFVVEDVVRVQQGPRNVRETVRNTAKLDGTHCAIVVPQDPGQAGKDQAEEYAGMLAGYTIRTPRETGDKVTRSGPASAQCEAGNVSLVLAPWNEPFIQSLEAFPDPAVHDDDVDAFAGAVSALALGDIPRQQRYLQAMRDVSKLKIGAP